MIVDSAKAVGSTTYRGATYYFCGKRCRERFETDPESFLAPAVEPPTAPIPVSLDSTTRYTCPMHPEIVRGEPGPCPICGMALEPQTVTLDDGPNVELVEMARR